ncbi:MAG TPA: hypothetical protein PLL33_07985 [Paracoccus sp. (in: a-proteobacteria)]|nr:hypothetical protein [Paracoccus sp. (in: a-proteobacteria)]
MTRDRSPLPPPDGADSRKDRLGAALRANLARRKAQARGRAAAQDDQNRPADDAAAADESED